MFAKTHHPHIFADDVPKVKEPSQCVYEATMTHPAACDPKDMDGSSEDRILGPHEAHVEL